MVVGIGEPPCSRIGSGAGEGIQGALRLGGGALATPTLATQGVREHLLWLVGPILLPGQGLQDLFLDIGEEKRLQPEWLLGLQGIEAGHDLTDEIEGPDLPDEIGRQAFSPPGFPSVLIDLRPERPGPVFLEPDPEPEVREDLRDRQDFNDKLQAVLTLAPFVGFCFLEIGYLNGRRAIERGRLSTGGALRIDLDPPTSTSAGSRLR